MATIINSPGNTEDSTATGMLIGIILVVLIILFFVFGLPYIRNSAGTTDNNPDTTNIEVNIPNPIDTNTTNNQTQNP